MSALAASIGLRLQSERHQCAGLQRLVSLQRARQRAEAHVLSTGLGARRSVDWKLSIKSAALLNRIICSTLVMT